MYCVMNIQKRKRQDITGIEREATRTATDYNNAVEPGMDIYNVNLIQSQNWKQDIQREIEKAGAKIRANSVVALDTVYTASPQFFEGKTAEAEENNRYFQDCLRFHQEQFGHVVSAVIHYDETTPHMHILSVPLTRDGRLSAREIVGNRTHMAHMQTEFFEQVGRVYGLERGQHRDGQEKREHITAQEHRLRQVTRQTQEQEQQLHEVKVNKNKELEELDAIKHSKTHARARAGKWRQRAIEQESRNIQAERDERRLQSQIKEQNDVLQNIRTECEHTAGQLNQLKGFLTLAEQRQLDELQKSMDIDRDSERF